MLGRYTFEGTSADGKLKTTLSLTEPKVPTRATSDWRKDSGVPLSALSEPGWEKRHPELAGGNAAAPAAEQMPARTARPAR